MRGRRFRIFPDRLGKQQEATAEELNAFLEVHFAGNPALVQRSLLSSQQREELQSLERTVAIAASWAAENDAVGSLSAQRERQRIWGQLMTSASKGTFDRQNAGSISGGKAPRSAFPTSRSSRTGRGLRWLNGAMTAVLIVAVLGAAVLTGQRFREGNGGDGGSTSLPGLAQSDGTPEPYPMDVNALEPVTMPTAADCTVEPLTVDEVVAILKEEPLFVPDFDYLQDIYPVDIVEIQTALDAPEPTPSVETMQQVADLRREWIACTMKASYFQKWALEDPWMVRRQLRTAIPIFASETDVRELLAQLEKNGWLPSLEGIANNAGPYVSLVDPAPRFTTYYVDYFSSESGELSGICTSQIIYDWQGSPRWRWLVSQHPLIPDMCFKQADGGQWIVTSTPPPIYYQEPLVAPTKAP